MSNAQHFTKVTELLHVATLQISATSIVLKQAEDAAYAPGGVFAGRALPYNR